MGGGKSDAGLALPSVVGGDIITKSALADVVNPTVARIKQVRRMENLDLGGGSRAPRANDSGECGRLNCWENWIPMINGNISAHRFI